MLNKQARRIRAQAEDIATGLFEHLLQNDGARMLAHIDGAPKVEILAVNMLAMLHQVEMQRVDNVWAVRLWK